MTREELLLILTDWANAIGYSYEGGELPPDTPDAVAKLMEPDGGLLAAANALYVAAVIGPENVAEAIAGVLGLE